MLLALMRRATRVAPAGLLCALGSFALPDTTPHDEVTRVAVAATGPEIVRGTLVLKRGVVYELRHDLQVENGTLVIEAGTRLEASAGASITIARDARIVADGTSSEPIIMTCEGPAVSGCWDGVIINGAARINEGTPTSPVIPGRDDTGACLEVSAAHGPYGGCADTDSSGVFRHVWLQYAGAHGDGALALRAVGSRTIVANVQVFASISEGVVLQGGTVNLRWLRIARAASAALNWSSGWRGFAQYGIIQASPSSPAAIDGGNNTAQHDATPRSAPVLRNFTIVGPAAVGGASGAAGVRLHSGTAATLQGFVVYHQPALDTWALDIDDAATWARHDLNELRYESSIFLGFAPLGALDADPPRQGFFSPDIEGQLLRETGAANRILVNFDSVAVQLKAPYGELQDLRPRPGTSTFGLPCNLPPGDPFFQTVTYCGALEPGLTTILPWNSPGPMSPLTQVPPSAPIGFLLVLVRSDQIGPLGGVTITAAGASAVTDFNGLARLYLPSGFQSYTLQGLPSSCVDPGLFFVNVPAGGSNGQTALIQC